jgi:hypothetical protein
MIGAIMRPILTMTIDGLYWKWAIHGTRYIAGLVSPAKLYS